MRGPASRPQPKKPRRRRQTDGAPTSHSCQLVTRPAHCRFERFQRVRARAGSCSHPRLTLEGSGKRSLARDALPCDGSKNKHSTEYDFRQEFSQPHAGVTRAAPTGRRRGAGPPRRSAEAVVRPPLTVQEQGVSFRGTGRFCMRTGELLHENRAVFARSPGTFWIRSTISFRRLLANSSEPTSSRNAPTPLPTAANEHT